MKFPLLHHDSATTDKENEPGDTMVATASPEAEFQKFKTTIHRELLDYLHSQEGGNELFIVGCSSASEYSNCSSKDSTSPSPVGVSMLSAFR